MSEPSVVTTEPTTVAYITMHGAYSQIPEAFAALYPWIAKHGLEPAGMPAAVYLTMPNEGCEDAALWEVWAPVAGDAAEREPDETGIGVKRIAPVTAATLMHRGPYETIEPAYRRLWEWIAENGYVPDGPPMERYFSDPAEVPPSEYLTEILMPVRRA